MNRSLAIKLGAIGLLILLLLIPLLMIGGVISDRQQLRDGVLDDIARSSSDSQQLSGPLLVVPYRKTVRIWKLNATTNERYQEASEESGRLYFLPERFELNGNVSTELRARGIYEARLFHAENRISGHFTLPERLGIKQDFADYQFEQPYLAVGISDIRGIENALQLELGTQRLDFVPGSQVGWLGEGVHVTLPALDASKVTELPFAFDLRLQGTGQLQMTPVGKTSQVKLAANWPHPSFIGNYLPAQREITADAQQGAAVVQLHTTDAARRRLAEVDRKAVAVCGVEVHRKATGLDRQALPAGDQAAFCVTQRAAAQIEA